MRICIFEAKRVCGSYCSLLFSYKSGLLNETAALKALIGD